MASGIGVNGGTGRCYPLWLDFTKCIAEADQPVACKAFREDYVECLHHFKEFRRAKQVSEEAKRQAKAKKEAAKMSAALPPVAASANKTS